MAELFEAVASWHSLLLVFVVFGFAPGFLLRLIVKIYPKNEPRRRELVAELYSLGRLERVLFVGEQLETVLFEGMPARARALRQRVRRTRKSRPPRTSTTLRNLPGMLVGAVLIFSPFITGELVSDQTDRTIIQIVGYVLLSAVLLVLLGLVTLLALRHLLARRREAGRSRDRAA
jgi:uncharacterized membrane protein